MSTKKPDQEASSRPLFRFFEIGLEKSYFLPESPCRTSNFRCYRSIERVLRASFYTNPLIPERRQGAESRGGDNSNFPEEKIMLEKRA
jgi:hypothetical protein